MAGFARRALLWRRIDKAGVSEHRPSQTFASPSSFVGGTAPGTFTRKSADAFEDAIWSAQRDTSTGYGIGVFDYEPRRPDGKTTITFRYYHAVGADNTPTGDYELFETIVFEKERGK